MNVAVTSTMRSIDGSVGTNARYGEFLLIVDIDTMEYEAILNPMNGLKDPSAIQLFAEILLQEDISKIFVNDCNPNVIKILEYSGIQVIDGISGTVRSTIKHFKEICNSDTLVMPVAFKV